MLSKFLSSFLSVGLEVFFSFSSTCFAAFLASALSASSFDSARNFSNAVSNDSFLDSILLIGSKPIIFSLMIPFCFKIKDASSNVAALRT